MSRNLAVLAHGLPLEAARQLDSLPHTLKPEELAWALINAFNHIDALSKSVDYLLEREGARS